MLLAKAITALILFAVVWAFWANLFALFPLLVPLAFIAWAFGAVARGVGVNTEKKQ